MKKFSQCLKENYILNTTELEAYISSKQINESLDKQSNLKSVERIILIGEMRFKSLRKVAKKLDYADPTKLHYTLDGNTIKVDDGEYKFTVSDKDKDNTVVIVRSGYKNQEICYLMNNFEKLGLTVINNADAVNISNNKYLLACQLSKFNIPQPKYVLTSQQDIHKGDDKALEDKLKKIYSKVDDDSKFVCKILGGHGGKGVFKCTKSNIMSVLQCIFAIDKDCQILVQEFMEIDGGDIRAHILTLNGKQTILSVNMRKKSGDDFRTNLSLGNQQEDYTLSKEQEKIAKDTAAASGLIWCGVDLMPLKNGKTVVVEYNGAPGPPSEIIGSQEELEQINEEFYKKFIESLNSLC